MIVHNQRGMAEKNFPVFFPGWQCFLPCRRSTCCHLQSRSDVSKDWGGSDGCLSLFKVGIGSISNLFALRLRPHKKYNYPECLNQSHPKTEQETRRTFSFIDLQCHGESKFIDISAKITANNCCALSIYRSNRKQDWRNYASLKISRKLSKVTAFHWIQIFYIWEQSFLSVAYLKAQISQELTRVTYL